MSLRVLPLALAVGLAFPALASADAVEPPPESCPAGSNPDSSHAGPLCRPAACSASTCAEGTCEPVMQCMETRACGGLRPADAGPCTVDTVVGPCNGDGTCDVGECRTRDVCSTEPGGSDAGGCGCRVGAASGGAGALVALGLALALLARRRR